MASTLLLHFFFLISLFTFILSKQCPPCGTFPVPYPLSTNPSCGDPSYPIICSSGNVGGAAAGNLIFRSVNNTDYPIISINPSSQRLIILPAPFSSTTSCTTTDLAGGGLVLNSSLPFNITAANTVMLLNCTDELLLSPLNCSATSACHAYIAADPAAKGCRSATSSSICCTFVAGGSSTAHELHVTPTACSAYVSFVNLNTASTPEAEWGRSAGVEMEWESPREPVCRSQADCEERVNATCAPDPESVGGAVRRCFCVRGLQWDPFTGACVNEESGCGDKCGRSSNHAALVAGLVPGLAASLLVSAAAYFLHRRLRRLSAARERLAKEREEILNFNNTSGRTAKNFTGREIKKSTANFSRDNLLGSGGYGDVFRGVLSDGTAIAVKCAKLGSIKSTDQVLNEVRILSQVNHRALVRLLGCCVELQQPIMVYEFIPNGSLADHLHGPRAATTAGRLKWRRRLEIARQTAEGLAYLHSSAVPPIYHRDVKSSNILLDGNLDAKVSDFGLSRLAGPPDASHVSTCAQGTLGYLDPEYYRNYQLTDKSDVYSFGVVLLELLTSEKALDFTRAADDINLAVYVARMVSEEKVIDVVDTWLKEDALGDDVALDTMKAVGFLAMSCIEERRQNRPSMKEVADEIEYIIGILDNRLEANAVVSG